MNFLNGLMAGLLIYFCFMHGKILHDQNQICFKYDFSHSNQFIQGSVHGL